MTNSADPDQLASSEANWSGSTLFAKTGHIVFSKRRVITRRQLCLQQLLLLLLNIGENTQEMPQSRITILPRHQKKERWSTNNDKTNATYETKDAQTEKNCDRDAAFERSIGAKISCARTNPNPSDAAANYKYSRTSMARTSLGPWKFVRDIGSSGHWGWIMTQGQEANGNKLGVFFIFYTIIVWWVYSLESPRWGDSNEYTQHTISW